MPPTDTRFQDQRWQPGGQFYQPPTLSPYEQWRRGGQMGLPPGMSNTRDNINGGAVGINNESTPNVPKYSPAVISDSTIREQVVPNLLSKAKTLTGSRKSPDQQRALGYKFNIDTGESLFPEQGAQNTGRSNVGTSTSTSESEPNAYDEWLDPYKKLLSDSENDPVYNAELELIKKMGANIDASSAAQMANITRKYAEREAHMKESQARETKGIENALNLGGSARYAPVSSSGILTEKEKYDMQALSGLQDEEETLKSTITTAQQDKNYELMGSTIALMEGKRKEKQALMGTIAEKMEVRNKEIADKKQKSSRERAIVDLFRQGITDPADMYDYLNFDENGNATGDISLDEIDATLSKVNKTDDTQGDVRQYLDAKKNGLIDPKMSYFDYQSELAASKESPLDRELKDIQIQNARGSGNKALTDAIDLENKFGDDYRKRDEVQRFSVTNDAYLSAKSLIGDKDMSKLTADEVKKLNLKGSDADTIAIQLARARNPDTAKAADNGEVGAAESISQIISQTKNGLMKGDKVLPDKVADALSTLDKLYKSRSSEVKKVNKEFNERAGRAKIKVPGIVGEEGEEVVVKTFNIGGQTVKEGQIIIPSSGPNKGKRYKVDSLGKLIPE